MSITPIKEFAKKQDAIDYVAYEKKLLSPNSLNSVLTRVGIFRACKIISETDGHPAQDAMLALFDEKTDKLNFIQGDPTGDAQIQMLDALIGAGITQVVGANTIDVSAQLGVAKPILLHECNTPYQPYKDITEYKWRLEKGLMLYSPISLIGEFAVLNLATDVEMHNPRICEYFANIDFYQPVGFLNNVSKAGKYVTKIKEGKTNLFIEDCYNMVV